MEDLGRLKDELTEWRTLVYSYDDRPNRDGDVIPVKRKD